MSDLSIARRYIAKADSAKDRGIYFDLTFAQYKKLQNTKRCFYTGIPLTHNKDRPNSFTLDLIDNSLGYVQGNVVACCLAFNNFKATFENPTSILTQANVTAALNKLNSLL